MAGDKKRLDSLICSVKERTIRDIRTGGHPVTKVIVPVFIQLNHNAQLVSTVHQIVRVIDHVALVQAR